MSKPTPSPAQIAAIQSTVAGQTNMQSALVASAALAQPDIDKATLVDAAFKSLFDWYNDKIIGKYDLEKKSINGIFVTTPVVEADITNVGANPPSGRLLPTTAGIYDIVRIPEFDGGNISTITTTEQVAIIAQTDVENRLVNGYGPGTFPLTLLTDTAITPTSTTLKLKDTAVAITIIPNQVFIVKNSGLLAVVKCLTITPDPTTPPPYMSDLTIELIVPPVGTITSGQTLTAFTGFTDIERTNKITTDSDYQSLMNYFITQLILSINDRKIRLAEQTATLNTNEDPSGIAAIAAANANITTSNNFLINYLLTTIISNSGLLSLSTERITRSGQLTARLVAITSAYTGQAENYYNARYSVANNRGNLQRGTLRAKSNAQSVQSNSSALAASVGGSINALNGILPS